METVTTETESSLEEPHTESSSPNEQKQLDSQWQWNGSTNCTTGTANEGSLMSLKSHYRKLRNLKGTVKALINLHRLPTLFSVSRVTAPQSEDPSESPAPKIAESVVKLADDEASLETVQNQVKSLVEKGYVVTERESTMTDDVTYRLQGNLDLYTQV